MKSKRHLSQFILIPFLTFFGFGFLILGLVMVHDTREMPFGTYIMYATTSSLSISLSLYSIYNLKYIQITEDYIVITFPVKRKSYKYELGLVKGYSERIDYDKVGKYKTFNFCIDDNTIYQFSSREYRNYNDLTMVISKISVLSTISFYKNLKPFLVYFMLLFILISLSLYISKII